MKKLLLILIVALGIVNVQANEPEVKNPAAVNAVKIGGKVTDHLTGEALAGVSLTLKGSGLKTYSDLDGNFKIEGVSPGTYDIVVDYVSYKKTTLTEISTSTSSVKLKVELESAKLPF